MGGGGVDGAIHRAGGPKILEACRQVRRTQYPQGLPTGEAVITTAGSLPSRHVIHTVGPIFGRHQGHEAELLAACYKNSLTLAKRHALSLIAFPSISTGAFGYPKADAAVVASHALEEALLESEGIEQVRLVFFQSGDREIFIANQKFSS
jgi:O-acetyl-ADP-ribose deacetylase (regulator of RNase III)